MELTGSAWNAADTIVDTRCLMYLDNYLHRGFCNFTKPELLYTSFDPNRILADYSTRNTSTALTFSNDAGHFLCDFIYFKALASSQTRRVVFVHVPMFSPEFTIDKLTQAIMDLIPALVTQA